MARRTDRALISLAAFVLATALATPDAPAHMGAKGVVRERMEVMKSMAAAMKNIQRLLRAPAAPDIDGVAAEAEKIAAHGSSIPSLFPHGSGDDVSEASPEIWKDPNGFARRVDALVDAARRLVATTKAGAPDEVSGAFSAVGVTCRECHRGYRMRK